MAVELATAYVSLVPSFRGGVRAIQREAAGMGSAVTDQMADEIESSSRSGRLSSAFSAIGSAAKLAAVGFGAVAVGAGAWGFQVAAQAEQAEMAFTTLLGSADKAKSYLQDLQNFAAKTPFEFPELRDAASRFIAVGVAADRVVPIMSTLGDATALMGTGSDGIRRATTALTQMSQKGKVSAEDMMQLTEAGIPAWDALAAVLGTDVKGAMDQVSKGTVTAESLFTALEQKAGPALQRVAGGMEKQAETFSGMWSTLTDTVGQGLGVAMRPILEMVTNFMPQITKAAEWLVELFGTVMTGAINGAISAFGWLKDAWKELSDGFRFEDNPGGVLGTIGDTARTVWETVSDVWPKVRDTVLDVIGAIASWVADVWPPVKDGLLGAFQSVKEWVTRNWPPLKDAVLKVLGAIVDWVKTHWSQIKDTLGDVFRAFRDAVTYIVDNKPILIGVLTAIGIHFGLMAVQATAAGLAAAAAWIAAAAIPIAIGVAIAALVAGLITMYQQVDWFRTAVDAVVDAVVAAAKWLADQWKKYADDVGRVLADIGRVAADIFMGIVHVVQDTIDVVGDIISVGVDVWKKAWVPIEILFKILKETVYDPIVFQIELMFQVVRTAFEVGVEAVKVAWRVIEGIYTFFRDNVAGPVGTVVGTMKDTVVRVIGDLVSTATTTWGGLVAIYNFFRDRIYNPIINLVGDLRDGIGNAFSAAVDTVKSVWDRLAGVVKAPIKLVIGFYNHGIAGVWNAVISKIPGVGNLPIIGTEFATGGYTGPGGKYEPAGIVHKGEFVLDQATTKNLGVPLLNFLLKNKGMTGTSDPGIFGYAQGGPVRTAEETKDWAIQQSGKPYRFPLVGPDAFDCSGLTSALINFVLGLNPWSRRHSSGSMGSDPALARGVPQDPGSALLFGALPPNTRNTQGFLVGHTAATIAGMNLEATPPRVRHGGNARGATDPMFPQQYFLPGFQALTEADKGLVEQLKSLASLALPNLGGPPIGDLLTKLFTDLPGRVFDFLMKKLPSVIVDAVKDAVGGFFKLITPFSDGGTVRHTGPVLLGENGPELGWANRGAYIQANTDLPGIGHGAGDTYAPVIQNYGQTVTPATIADGIRMSRSGAGRHSGRAA
jgi:tape measure domain-containing protein